MKQNQLEMIQNNHLLNWGKATLLLAGLLFCITVSAQRGKVKTRRHRPAN